jgi:hypothetical protein
VLTFGLCTGVESLALLRNGIHKVVVHPLILVYTSPKLRRSRNLPESAGSLQTAVEFDRCGVSVFLPQNFTEGVITEQINTSRGILEKLVGSQLTNSQLVVEREGSLPCSQQLDVCPYPKPDESSARPPIPFL